MSNRNQKLKRRNETRSRLRSEQLEARLLLASDVMSSWQNPINSNDINQDGYVSPLDGLVVTNNINRFGSRQLGEMPAGEPGSSLEMMLVDANGDGFVSALDVLQVNRALQPNGEGELVGVRLEVTDLDGNGITSVNVGDEFRLSTFVADLRGEDVGGVFGAYVDVDYDNSLASVNASGIEFGDTFTNGKDGDSSTPGVLDEVGAFTGSLTPLGSGESLLFSVTMTADAVGELVFDSNPADVRPAHEILLFDLDTAVPVADVDFGSFTLTIQGDQPAPDPPAIETTLESNTLELEIESPRQLPINGIDNLGGGLTYTVSVANPSLVEAEFTSDNRSWSVDVADHGTLVFEFFEGRAPRVTDRFIELTESDFFDGLTFHRVIDEFVIQGGDPLGNGTGGSDLGNFDDQFHVDLQHNQAGVLSMAKSSDDTNNSQFFVTDAETPWLDFNHSIFGQLVEGFDVLDSISAVPVSTFGDRPIDDVVITEATVFEDNENAILSLRALASSGTTDVTITATDEDGQSVSETISISLAESSSNTPPFLADIPAFNAAANSTFMFQLTATDIEGDDLIFGVDVVSPSDATATVSETGLVEVEIPDASSASEVALQVSVRQFGSSTDEQLVRIAIDQTISGEVAADEFDIQEDVTDNFLEVLANDGLDETAMVISVTSDSLIGMANVDSDGQTIVYAPAADFFGVETFTYLVQTQDGIFEGNVTVNVENVLDGPNAVDDFFPQDLDATDPSRELFVEDSAGDVPLTTLFLNDLNADGDEQEIMTITSVTDPEFGSVAWNAFQIRYTPGPDFFGTETFTYTTTGSGTGLTSTATVTVEVDEVNDAPIVQGESQTVTGGRVTVVTATNLLANDTPGPDNESGQVLRLSDVSSDGDGVVRINDDGDIEYTPAPGFSGTETITYTVEDDGTTRGEAASASATAELTVTVEASDNPNDPPITVDDDFDVVADRPNQLLNVLANDITEPGETLLLTQILDAPDNGTVLVSADAKILIYTPADGFQGSDTLTYEVSDGNGGLASATAFITVAPEFVEPNNPPTAVADSFEVNADQPNQLLNVLANDSIEPDTDEVLGLTAILVEPQNGTVTISADNLILIYTPNDGFSGSDSLIYEVGDGNGGVASAEVQITVGSDDPVDPNQPPTAVNDDFEVDENSANQLLDVLDNDTILPDVGELLGLTQILVEPSNGTVTISADGLVLIYTPNADFSGTDALTYEVSDGNGGVASAEVQITVVADDPVDPNQPPSAFNDDFEVDENSADQLLDVLANDTSLPDVGETLSLTQILVEPTNGTVAISADGLVLIYTPNADFVGMDTLTYQVSDGNGGLASAEVEVTVTAADPVDPPVENTFEVQDDQFTVVSVGQQTYDVLVNDTPSVGATLTITSVDLTGSTGSAVVSEDGSSVLYDPNFDSPGTDTFTYTVEDSAGNVGSGTVTVTVPEQNEDVTYAGQLFNDLNNDSLRSSNELGLGGISFLLTGRDLGGNDVSQTTETSIDGQFSFAGIGPGEYTITQEQPPFINDGQNTFELEVTDSDSREIVITEGQQSSGDLYGERGLTAQFALLEAVSSQRDSGLLFVMEGSELAWVANRGGWEAAGNIDITMDGDTLTLASSELGSQQLSVTDSDVVQMLGTSGAHTMIRISGTTAEVLSAAAVDQAFAEV